MAILKQYMPLKPTVEMIMEDIRSKRVSDMAEISQNIDSGRDLAVNEFLRRSRKGPNSKNENEIWGYLDSWLHHALGVAFAIEQFHAHANYRNPHPKHKKDGTVHVDKSHRTDRSEVVQAWLTEQDRYLKVFTSSILMLIHQVQASKEGATPPFLLL